MSGSSRTRPLVVVGGGPAGLAAARAFREADPNTPVVLVCAEPHPPYARPPLTKGYLRGEIARDDLWLAPISWYADHRVELRLGTEARHIDRVARTVGLADGSALEYASLVLATGSSPRPLPVPGGDHPELIYVRDLASGQRLARLAAGSYRERVLVVGSGFIGCEVAASLAACGVPVSLVSDEALPQATRLGRQAGETIASWLAADGVEVRGGAAVASIVRREGAWSVTLSDGSLLEAEHVVCGSGAEPNLVLAQRAELDDPRWRRGGRRPPADRGSRHLRRRGHRLRRPRGGRS